MRQPASLTTKADGSDIAGDRKADLAALIARLEKATGPDRELDARIYAACFHPHGFDRMAERAFNRHDLRSYVWYDTEGRRITCWGDKAFTGSLDAAVTLVPEGFYWSYDIRGCAIVCAGEPPSEIYGDCRGHPSPVIALCIAALKARGEQP